MEPELVQSILKVEPEHWWFRARRTIALSLVEQLTPKTEAKKGELRILDVGAGSGFMAEALTRFGRVQGLEFDPASVARLKERKGVEVLQTKLPDPSVPAGTYDLVTSFDVLEHIPEDQAVLSEMARLVKPGGFLLLTVPAHQWLWTSHDDVNHHIRRYGGREFREKLQATGLKMRLCSPHLTLLFPLFLLQRLLHRLFPPRHPSVTVKLPGRIVNGLLYSLYSVERFFLRRGIPLPFGASYLALLEKPLQE